MSVKEGKEGRCEGSRGKKGKFKFIFSNKMRDCK